MTTPAAWPREDRLDTRLLLVDPETATVEDRRFDALPGILRPGDLLVVNDAATLPASLEGTTEGGPVEVRLASRGHSSTEWMAVLFGAGDWRQRTEDRPPPPALVAGDVIRFGEELAARVERVLDLSPRLVHLRFDRRGARSLERALQDRPPDPVLVPLRPPLAGAGPDRLCADLLARSRCLRQDGRSASLSCVSFVAAGSRSRP